MAKSSAAKNRRGIDTSPAAAVHAECGHPFHAHPNYPAEGPCPALPPGRQTVDQAVETALKGGKPDSLAKQGRDFSKKDGRTFWDGTGFTKPPTEFERELAAATGPDTQAERKKLALVNFEKTPGEPERMLISVKQLRPMANNPRSEVGDVTELERSMRSPVGFIGALWVREVIEGDARYFEVFSGNRRLKAAKQAGLTEIPCDVYDITAGQALELNLTEQINRKELSPLEEGEGCRELMELQSYNKEQVAEKMGQSVSWVTKRVALCGLAPELKKSLAGGVLPLTVANALAALPTQQLQVKSFGSLPYGTAEQQVAAIREKVCRPLADATWKLTDAELLPEAGACSTCPFNSSNQAMPGLFDNAKAKPTCAKTECFDDKASEAWLSKTAKQKAAGAKVLSLAEGRKLFHGAGGPLPESSRYVEGNVAPKKDKKGRTWVDLVAELPEEARPQLHLAQDGAGKVRLLYVADKVGEAVATHVKGAKWAAEAAEEATSARSAKAAAKQEDELAQKHREKDARNEVIQQVLGTVAAKLAADFTRPAALLLVEESIRSELPAFEAALGRKLPKDWVEKGATLDELLSLAWFIRASNSFSHPWESFDEAFLLLAKANGFNVKTMFEAQLATAKLEAEKAAKS